MAALLISAFVEGWKRTNDLNTTIGDPEEVKPTSSAPSTEVQPLQVISRWDEKDSNPGSQSFLNEVVGFELP